MILSRKIAHSTFMIMMIAGGSAMAQPARFAVMADPHFYDWSLGTTGPAFEQYLMQDRKMLRESEAILEGALRDIASQHPNFVIISGDLTKDGERSSHEKLAARLAELEAEGVEVFVVPGNHDINNPHAVSFAGETMTPVANVSPEDFAAIYGQFGYDQAIYRDSNSLSYVAEPVKGVWLFGIDSCNYADNLVTGHPETSGRLSDETLSWIVEKLEEAKRRKKAVAGFMHHGLLEHYTGQSQLFAEYVIDDWQPTSEVLKKAGLQLVFTGHYHANDITRSAGEEPLFDVETGSLVTYPSPYRLVDLHGGNAAAVRTRYVEEIDYDTGGKTFPEYAEEFLANGLSAIAGYTLTLAPEQGGFGLTQQEAMGAAGFVAQSFMAHYAGDEHPEAATVQQLQQYLTSGDPRYVQLGQALGTLWTDLAPTDGSALLSLSPTLELTVLGTYATSLFNEGAAEISAFDPRTRTLFVVNGAKKAVDMLDISDPSQPVPAGSLDISAWGSPNSVAVANGLVAVAVEADNTQENGTVVLFTTAGHHLRSLPAGALPDMVTFTPDGRYILVANEGEPNADYSVDPEGSVTIIDLGQGVRHARVRNADFTAFNPLKEKLIDSGVRIFGPNATVAQDLEPEYITVLDRSPFAWVSLQENNAVAKIDLRSGKVMDITPLGSKNHGDVGNGLDASDKDGIVNVAQYAGLFGMYQPDAIAAYRRDTGMYLVTANEGDARDYDTFAEEARVGDLTLDPQAFPNREWLQEKGVLGRLTVTQTRGDIDNDGDYDELHAFGARSFSIFASTPEGLMPVFDSGDQIEIITAAANEAGFNSNNDANDSFDSRSDNKGPEPEGLAVGTIAGRTYAFLGLERVGGIVVYEITHPRRPEFVQYMNNRDFSGDAEAGTAGDLGPEGITFISERQSPTGVPMLAVSNEISGTITLYQINLK